MKAAKILGVIAVFIGSTCCFWATLLAMIGLGSFGIVPNPFVGLGLGFAALGLGWFFYTRQRRKCLQDGCLNPTDRSTKLILGVSSVFLILFAAYTLFPYLAKGKSVKECCLGGLEKACDLFKPGSQTRASGK